MQFKWFFKVRAARDANTLTLPLVVGNLQTSRVQIGTILRLLSVKNRIANVNNLSKGHEASLEVTLLL
jgi:hypothetical protein